MPNETHFLAITSAVSNRLANSLAKLPAVLSDLTHGSTYVEIDLATKKIVGKEWMALIAVHRSMEDTLEIQLLEPILDRGRRLRRPYQLHAGFLFRKPTDKRPGQRLPEELRRELASTAPLGPMLARKTESVHPPSDAAETHAATTPAPEPASADVEPPATNAPPTSTLASLARRLTTGATTQLANGVRAAIDAYERPDAPLKEAVDQLADALLSLGERLPSHIAIQGLLDQVTSVAQRLELDADEPLEVGRILDFDLSWSALHAALELILDLRGKVPLWVFDHPVETANEALQSAARLANDPMAQRGLQELRQHLPELLARLPELSELRAPIETDGAPYARVSGALEAHLTSTNLDAQIERLPDWIHAEQRASLRERAAKEPSVVETIAAVAANDHWGLSMHADLRAELTRALLLEPTAVAEDLARLSRIAEPTRRAIAGRALLTLLDPRSPKLPGPGAPGPAPSASSDVVVSALHALSSGKGVQKVVLRAPFVGESFYCSVDLPILLSLEPPPSEDSVLELDAEGDFLSSLPSGGRTQEPAARVPLHRGKSNVDAVVRVTMSRAFASKLAEKGQALRVGFRARGRGFEMNANRSNCEWDLAIDRGDTLAAASFHLPQEASLEDVERRPFGLQKQLPELLTFMSTANRGFTVMGYRRYGKTSLVRAAIKRLQAAKKILICDLLDARALSPERIWDELGKFLANELERPCTPVVPAGGVPVPAADSFDAVRRQAKQEKYQAIFVVIDEAQQFFAADAQIANQIRAHNQLSWGLADDRGMVPLLFGFVGTTALQRAAGDNFLQTLKQFHASAARAEDLEDFLREARGLHSSRLARERLAREAANLLIFEQIYGEIATTCDAAGRRFFLESDVEQAVERIADAAQQDANHHAWTYLRDALNDAIRVEDWEPKETYPVALALARALSERSPVESLAHSCAQNIEALCGELEIDVTRVESGFASLVEDGVIVRTKEGSYSFRTPLLERVLRDRSRRKDLFKDEGRSAAELLGLRRVRRPEALAEGVSGNQGRVYPGRHPHRARPVSVRLVPLSKGLGAEVEPDALRRFHKEVDALLKLREVMNFDADLRHDCVRHLPELVEVGLDEADPRVGVVIYDWIPGQTLELVSAKNPLDTIAVISLGHQLSRALVALETAKIVHRDIAARNVVLRAHSDLSEGAFAADFVEPVLIDFGLASAVGDGTLVGIRPPEVTAPEHWTAKADVYGLGQMLEALPRVTSQQALDQKLRGLLKRACHPTPGSRLSPKQLHSEFQALRTEAANVEKLLRASLQPEAADLPRHLGSLAIDGLVGLKVGLPSTRVLRYAALAFFLENALQYAVRADSEMLELFLRAMSPHNASTMLNFVWRVAPPNARWTALREVAKACSILGELRNVYGHPLKADEWRKAREGQSSIYDPVREAASSVAPVIDSLLSVSGGACGSVTKTWLELTRRNGDA